MTCEKCGSLIPASYQTGPIIKCPSCGKVQGSKSATAKNPTNS